MVQVIECDSDPLNFLKKRLRELSFTEVAFGKKHLLVTKRMNTQAGGKEHQKGASGM